NENSASKHGYCRVQHCANGEGRKHKPGLCTTCENGYYLYANVCNECLEGKYKNNGQCVPCQIGCYLCSKLGTCKICADGYYKSSYGICSECPLCDRCHQENNDIKCDGNCVEGYYKNNNNMCKQCPYNCDKCSNGDTCTKCTIGYYLTKGSCIACPSNCNSCSSTTKCTICNDGYLLNLETKQCDQCDVNCNACKSGGGCLECKPSYYLMESECVSCPISCKTCSTTTSNCTECNSNEVFMVFPEIGCESCNSFDSNCFKCDAGFSRFCSECKTGYYRNDSKCVACSYSCNIDYCDKVYGYCYKCAMGYTKLPNEKSRNCQQCHDFDDHCDECSQDNRMCLKCNQGYYPLKVYPFTCELCNETCKDKCNNLTGICTSCVSGYVLKTQQDTSCESCTTFDPKCITCAENGVRSCVSCKDTYKPNPNGGFCIQCDSTCLKGCDGTIGICLTCNNSYVPYLEPKTSCEKCTDFDSKCLACYPNERKCFECISGFYPSNKNDETQGKCIQCESTCLKCSPLSGNCTQCQSTYVFTSPHSEMCESCADFDKYCDTCFSDYTRNCSICTTTSGKRPNIFGGVCIDCDSTCVVNNCDRKSGICNKCQQNYVFDNPKKQSCILCKNFDINCKTCSPDFMRKCIECNTNYYPTKQNNGDVICVKCDGTCGGLCSTTTGFCRQCADEYIPTNPISFHCESCSNLNVNCSQCIKDERKCKTCKSNMYPNLNGVCIDCDKSCNLVCDTTNGNCINCLSNYVHNTANLSTCIPCITFDKNCLVCSTDYSPKCIQCNNFYYPNTMGICIPCGSGCLQCDTKNGQCIVCELNYVFNDKTGITCESCNTFDINCSNCSSSFERMCIKCTTTDNYPQNGMCKPCDPTCGGSCDPQNGKCLTCQNDFVFKLPQTTSCESCTTFDSKCTTEPGSCSSNYTRACNKCITNYYPGANGMCQICDSSCGGVCDTTNGTCLSCENNFVFINSESKTCQKCSLFDTNCNKCATDFSRKCIECIENYYPNSEGKCVQCDSSCNKKCNTQTGFCTGCINNYVMSGLKCIPCNTFNINCSICDSTGLQKCVTCNNHTFASNGNCVECSDKCEKCDGSNGHCTACGENQVLKKDETNTCEKCTDFDPKCAICASDSSRNCVTCESNYHPVLTLSEMKCYQCDDSCGGKCDTTFGYCTSCSFNYVLYDENNLKCQNCSNFDMNCKICSPNFKRKCNECKNGYRPVNETEGKCVSCDSTCLNRCDGMTGYCTSCIPEYVITQRDSSVCITCRLFDPNCKKCSPDSTRKCVECDSKYYPVPQRNGEIKCQLCNETCGGQCNSTNGYCIGCLSQYVPTTNHPNSLFCESCQIFDNNCNKCVENERNCLVCNNGMYPDEINGICRKCDESCNAQCNTTNGYCKSCKLNYVFNANNKKICSPCNTFDINCSMCSTLFERKCVLCNEGYQPNENGVCVSCTAIPNCKKCSQSEMKCLLCYDPYYQFNKTCASCPVYQYKKDENTCENCYVKIPNCNLCSTTSTGTITCNECITPYVIVNGMCVLCQSYEYYDISTKTCLTLDTCSLPINSTKCLQCELTYFVSNAKCVELSECHSPSTSSKTSCDCYDQISINSICTPMITNCKYQKSFKGVANCIQCVDKYTLTTDFKCLQTNIGNKVMRNEVIYQCEESYYLDNNNMCKSCELNTSICINHNNKVNSLKCNKNCVIDVDEKTCLEDSTCEITSNESCVKCHNKSSEISKGKCSICSLFECEICEGGICKKCSSDFLKPKHNMCVHKSQLNCEKSSQFGCVLCSDGYHPNDVINNEGKYEFCMKNNNQLCKHFSLTKEKCVECFDAYKLKGGVCSENFDAQETPKNENNISTDIMTLKTEDTNGCEERNNKGCQRCFEGFYIDSTECLKCNTNCKTCSSTSRCLTCEMGHFLDTNYVCQSLGDLFKKCLVTLPNGNGCAICKDGYFKSNGDCNECDDSCLKCVSRDKCQSCQINYFKIPTEITSLCLPYDSNVNCISMKEDGCYVCENGYYLSLGRCIKCYINCTSCSDSTTCISCAVDYILISSSCVHYSEILHCKSAKNSKCEFCNRHYKPSDDGESCIQITNYGVVIGVPLFILVALIIVISLIIVIIYLLIMKQKEKKKLENICVFQMKRSNITMIALNKQLCSNKNPIKFDLEEDSPINVDQETRDLICVGNTSKHNLKVQFSVIDGCDHYEIRTVPSLITLKRGEACEFEIFIKPLCSCKIEEDVMLIALDLELGIQINEKIRIISTTKQSTKLDYHELIESKKIGEGSFGIVNKGTYRGNTVAIKKMKNAQATKSAVDEFTKEVAMLDKFRNDFVIHFYGACYIPSHICMVTEYAEHSSLEDMISKEKEISLKMKVKIICDGAQGISYLHENGILHRDIKPDNILVITMENNVKANGKLTDFGSSRNINLLMTNMTFTKGIGTPKYMAPEVLNKEHYKKSSDVFSLAITFYETLVWGEIYPKSEFKFAWSIADYVTSGKRKERPEKINIELYEVLTKMWGQKGNDRIDISTVIKTLQKIYNSL
ncbi:protein kinase domain containing protein, partial [Entamoeba invadens IP1]